MHQPHLCLPCTFFIRLWDGEKLEVMGYMGRVAGIKGSAHRLLSVHCHGSVTINIAKCPLSVLIQVYGVFLLPAFLYLTTK